MRRQQQQDTLEKGLNVGLLVRIDDGREYMTIQCDFVTVSPQNEIRNGLDTWTHDLQIRCQGEQDTVGDRRYLYGFGVEYFPHSVDLRRAGQMYRTLLRVAKGMEKLDHDRGYPASYAEYVHRVAEILKAKYIIQILQKGSFYTDGEYRFMTPGEGRNWIAGLEREWKARKQETPA
jgi:hypothetical protein